MQIILIEDVKALGKKGELVNVSDGYARNFILPKKLGLEATPKNLNDLKLQKAAEAKRQKEILEEAQAFSKQLEDVTVKLTIKSGKDGRTFGSISSKEVCQALKDQYGYEVDKKKIVMNDAIKNAGTFHVQIKLHPKVTGEIAVRVDAV